MRDKLIHFHIPVLSGFWLWCWWCMFWY